MSDFHRRITRSTPGRRMAVAAAGGLLAALLPGAVLSQATATSGPVSGNATCKELLNDPNAFEIKVDPVRDGTYGPVTADFNDAKTLLSFTSTSPIDAVFVKGGKRGGGYFYDYTGSPRTSDSNLGTAGYGNGTQQISHVSFCWREQPVAPQDLTARKTATATYEENSSWALVKTASPTSHSGTFGQVAGTSTWTVTATKTVVERDFRVVGDIIINNPNAFPVSVDVTDTLNDGTVAAVDCDPTAAGNQTSGTVPARSGSNDGQRTCTYVATPGDRSATLNTATVTSTTQGVQGASATAPVSWTKHSTGDRSVVISDDRAPAGTFPASTSSTSTYTYEETFTCSSDPSRYTNRAYSESFPNTATATGPSTNLSSTATVTVSCTNPEVWVDETATGEGPRYPGSSNWFMYTPYTTQKVDLIAGQHFDAGDIYMTRTGLFTQIRIVLHPGFRFDDVGGNVKIQPFATAPTGYVPPGRFEYKAKATGSEHTATVRTADFYGIHVDVERSVS